MTEAEQPDSHDVDSLAEAEEHTREARQRVMSGFHTEEHVHGAGYMGEVLTGCLRGASLSVVVAVAALAVSEGVPAPATLAMLLLVIGVGFALAEGAHAGSAQAGRMAFYNGELERERAEIQDDPAHERAEMMALYSLKGLEEPLLSQTVDAICADPDKLLKVMMEEELGLVMVQFDHPIAVGLAQGFGTLVGFLPVTLGLFFSGAGGSLSLPLAAGAVVIFAAEALSALNYKQPVISRAMARVFTLAIAASAAWFVGQFVRTFLEN